MRIHVIEQEPGGIDGTIFKGETESVPGVDSYIQVPGDDRIWFVREVIWQLGKVGYDALVFVRPR